MNAPSPSSAFGKQVQILMNATYPERLRLCNRYPLWTALGYLTLATSIHLVLALAFGVFSGTPNVIDFSEDFNYLVVQLILGTGIYYYFALPHLLERTFDSLCSEQVFMSAEVKIDQRIQHWLKARWVLLLPYILTLVVSILWLVWVLITSTKPGYGGQQIMYSLLASR
jgi:ABC-type uncharacterized transport system permease subunit